VWSGEFVENKDEGAPGGYVHIENTVTVELSAALAKTWFAIFDKARVPLCIGEALRSAELSESPGLQRPGNSVGRASTARLHLPRFGDETVANRITVPLTAEGRDFTVYLDYALVLRGRAHMMLSFEKLDGPVPGRLERRLTGETTRRLQG
jgi:hypothetical protein